MTPRCSTSPDSRGRGAAKRHVGASMLHLLQKGSSPRRELSGYGLLIAQLITNQSTCFFQKTGSQIARYTMNFPSMIPNKWTHISCLLVATSLQVATVSAATPKRPDETALTEVGNKLLAKYTEQLKALQSELATILPKIDEHEKSAIQKARSAVKKADAEADAAQKSAGKIQEAKALVEHAKGKWIGGAEKGIAQAEAARKVATTDAQREAAARDLAKWQANKEDGLKALKERQEALEKAKSDEARVAAANQTAKAALAQARAAEVAESKLLLTKVEPVLAVDKLDAKLVKCAVLSAATPRALAEFSQRGREQESLVEKLLADPVLMKQMLEAGGAKFGKYGRAMEIFAAIQKASAKATEGTFQNLALAISLEHATPIAQSNPGDQTGAPTTVDPVKRYSHYEKSFLEGELDPAFKNLSVWELRMVVDCDAPDHTLAWGREMLRNYRPDHIYTADYGWRYSAAVRTEVRYGSQNVKDDLSSLQNYQNIIKNGGVCGRRAFFGRFILQSFGIPTWGVTQHKHAAVGHWTPKGWVINLGAGFEHSWWDKDEAPRSGADFLLETQAREHTRDYIKVLRAQWISRSLGEQPFNDRKGIDGGIWSSIAQYQTAALAGSAVALGPLGQELAEANEAKGSQTAAQPKVANSGQNISVGRDGVITIPAAAFSKPSGHFTAMKSFSGGMQLHCVGGFKAEYTVEVPQSGQYQFNARVVTVQDGQKLRISTAGAKAPSEIAVPYTVGKWQQTQPLPLALTGGKNIIQIALAEESRGVSIKEFTLSPVK